MSLSHTASFSKKEWEKFRGRAVSPTGGVVNQYARKRPASGTIFYASRTNSILRYARTHGKIFGRAGAPGLKAHKSTATTYRGSFNMDSLNEGPELADSTQSSWTGYRVRV